MTAPVELLAAWLPEQRWFGGKGRPIARVDVNARTPLTGSVDHLLLCVQHEDGGAERYQLLLGRSADELPDRLRPALIGSDGTTHWYDAVHDGEATAQLLRLLSGGGEPGGALRFQAVADLDPDLPSRVMGAEQSNTSLVYGEECIVKLFRRVQVGTNPDLEIARALAGSGTPHVAPLLAWAETDVDGEPTTLAMAQPFLKGATEGWASAAASVRDLLADLSVSAAEAGGDFAGESERLGAATAEVHRLMAERLPSATADEEESRATAAQLLQRLDAALAVVEDLAPHADALRAAYAAVGRRTDPVPVQRVHGDYHLGQVLRTTEGWVLLDFEGEPARPLTERTALMSPLRDVAGMLRSFDYAARHLLADRPPSPELEARAMEWAQRNRDAFCDGYAAASGADPRDEPVLLRAFELDKAVYEVVYEARNRPGWLQVPLGSVARIAREVERP